MIDVAPNDGLCGPIAYNRVKEGINQPLSLIFPIQLWLISKVPRFSLSLHLLTRAAGDQEDWELQIRKL